VLILVIHTTDAIHMSVCMVLLLLCYTVGDGVPEAPVGVSATETATGAGSQKQAVAAPAGGPAERDAPDSPGIYNVT
jgi:hypothetical protein